MADSGWRGGGGGWGEMARKKGLGYIGLVADSGGGEMARDLWLTVERRDGQRERVGLHRTCGWDSKHTDLAALEQPWVH